MVPALMTALGSKAEFPVPMGVCAQPLRRSASEQNTQYCSHPRGAKRTFHHSELFAISTAIKDRAVQVCILMKQYGGFCFKPISEVNSDYWTVRRAAAHNIPYVVVFV
jgi:hypothetical protein